MRGYQGIGSFHSPTVAAVVRKMRTSGGQRDSLVAPLLRRLMPDLMDTGRPLFSLDQSRWTFLNHGAFGAALRPVTELQHALRLHTEAQPLRFVDRQLMPLLARSALSLSQLCGCPGDPLAIVPMPHATAGLNVAFAHAAATHSAPSLVLMADLAYGSVKKMARGGLQPRVVPIPLPVPSAADVLDAFRTAMLRTKASRERVAMVVLDHITSNTALLMPVEELVGLCREILGPEVLVLVDGAHGLGSVPLELEKLGADFYVGNCHKWFCAPKGSGFMYCSERVRDTVQPLYVSHGHGQGFLDSFSWDGCRDYSASCSIPAVAALWEAHHPEGGLASVMSRNRALLAQAADLLCQRWSLHADGAGTPFLTTAQELRHAPSMTCVRLPWSLCRLLLAGPGSQGPVALFGVGQPDGPCTSVHAKAVQDALYFRYRVEVPVKCLRGFLFVRVSCHLYNTLEQYARLADCVLDLQERAQAGHEGLWDSPSCQQEGDEEDVWNDV